MSDQNDERNIKVSFDSEGEEIKDSDQPTTPETQENAEETELPDAEDESSNEKKTREKILESTRILAEQAKLYASDLTSFRKLKDTNPNIYKWFLNHKKHSKLFDSDEIAKIKDEDLPSDWESKLERLIDKKLAKDHVQTSEDAIKNEKMEALEDFRRGNNIPQVDFDKVSDTLFRRAEAWINAGEFSEFSEALPQVYKTINPEVETREISEAPPSGGTTTENQPELTNFEAAIAKKLKMTPQQFRERQKQPGAKISFNN